MLTLQERHEETYQKLNLLLKYTFFYRQNIKIFLIWQLKQFCIYNIIVLTVLLECKTEKGNSQHEHRQPMEQARGLFCTCDSGVACCQSQHQCNFRGMSSVLEAYWAWRLSIKLE